jgi:hypothetical protein
MNEARMTLSWSQIAWGLAILLAIGAAYTDLRMTLTRVETQQASTLRRVDRIERLMDTR